MSDPFKRVARRQRFAAGGLVLLLTALSLAVAYLRFGTVNTGGKLAEVEILQVGTIPVAKVAGGTAPFVTVRMADGSIRQLFATWADVQNCAPGRWLSVIENGAALQVGRPGCNKI